MQNLIKKSVAEGTRLKGYECTNANEIAAVCNITASSIGNDILESVNCVSVTLDETDDVDEIVTFFELVSWCRTAYLLIFHLSRDFEDKKLDLMKAIGETYDYDDKGWLFFDTHNDKLCVLYKCR